jgi:hypothetical protein
MAEYPYPDPIVQVTDVQDLARDLVVIPNRRVPLVPNIGIIAGTHSVLIIETGLGPRNAEKVLAFAADYAKGRKLYLTTTHFHPEHAFGAQVFAGRATYLLNKAQADDLATKGPGYIGMFRGLGEPVARQLDGVELATPVGRQRLDRGRAQPARPEPDRHSGADRPSRRRKQRGGTTRSPQRSGRDCCRVASPAGAITGTGTARHCPFGQIAVLNIPNGPWCLSRACPQPCRAGHRRRITPIVR